MPRPKDKAVRAATVRDTPAERVLKIKAILSAIHT
jgi:hypothetical protein